jgi:RND family efflux transporter MFP subunit
MKFFTMRSRGKSFGPAAGATSRFIFQQLAGLSLCLPLVVTPANAEGGALIEAEFAGTVVPAREAEITPIVSAWLKSIHFEPGQMVGAGDVLFEFHLPPAELRLQLAQAQLSSAGASLRHAIAEVTRTQNLLDRNATPAVNLEKNEALREIAAANVAQAEANVELAKLGVMQMTQKAPFAGVMSAPLVRENGWQDVSGSGRESITMAIITQLDPIQVVGEVPYDIYAQRQKMFGSDEALRQGLELSIILPDGTPYPYPGKLVSGGYTFDENSQTIRVWAEFPNPDSFLRPGLKVTVESVVKDR